MKSSILLLSVIITISSYLPIHSQVYQPMPDSNTFWHDWVFQSCFDGRWGFSGHACNIYGIAGDTIIDSMTYHKIHWYDSLHAHDSTSQYMFSMREDSSKKVWILLLGSDTPKLYYDFGLNIGDTFHWPQHDYSAYYTLGIGEWLVPETWYSGQVSAVLTSYDSIMIASSYRKRMNFDYVSNQSIKTMKWIEGIGGHQGLIYFANNMKRTCTSDKDLVAVYQDDTLLYYDDPDYYGPIQLTDCSVEYQYTSIGNENLHISIDLYPNPTGNVLVYSIPTEARNGQISIRNIQGKQVIRERCDHANGIIQMHHLTSGMYLVEYLSDSGEGLTKRIYKQ